MDCNRCLNKEKCNTKNKETGRMPTYGKVGDKNSLPKITSAFLILTQACNLKCKYCFVIQKPRHMTYEIARDAVDFLAKNAKERNEIPSITYFGGEPLLKYEDIIVPLTLYIREKYGNNFNLSMTTNGVLLDREKLEFMKENDIGFMVSIDGNKITSDKNRPCHDGRSSFDIIAPKIPMFLEYEPNMTFRMTLDHDNVDEYYNNHKFAIEHGYKNTFSIVNVFSKWSEEEKEELKKQVRKLGDYYIELLLQGNEARFNPLDTMFNKIRRVEEAERNKTFRNECEGLLAFGRCGLGASKFASIGTDGTLYSCQEMCDNDIDGGLFKIGNIYDGEDNDKRMKIISMFDIKKVHSTPDMDCTKCPFYRICDGSCTVNNYFANKDFNVMPSILCYYYQLLFNEAKRIKEIGESYKEVAERFKEQKIVR